jgi:hypothetical protein
MLYLREGSNLDAFSQSTPLSRNAHGSLRFRDFGAGTSLVQPAFSACGKPCQSQTLQRSFDGFLA